MAALTLHAAPEEAAPPHVPHPREAGRGLRRYLFFTNECVGLGHLRRSLVLAGAVREADPHSSALIVTGSQVVPHEPPPGVDLVKLPALGRDLAGNVGARSLGVPATRITEVRAHLALAAARAFDPDVVVVDKLPLGLDRELLPTLQLLRRGGRCRIVLGLRDIEDDPAAVRRKWAVGRLHSVVRQYYDSVLVYGPESSLDALDCVTWSGPQPDVTHVGYVGTPLPSSGPADLPPGYLLVTTGGGADGFRLAATVLAAVRARPVTLPVVLVAGPLMPGAKVEELTALAEGLDVRVIPSRTDFPSVVVGARAAIAMAGYNTVSELLRSGTPALLVPRVAPSREQLVRATRLAEAGLAHMALPDELSAASMSAAIKRLLARPRPVVSASEYDGAGRAARALVGRAELVASAS